MQRAAGGAFLIRIGSAAIAFLSQPLLARLMGSHEFGIYAYVWTWALLFGGLVDCGLSTAAQRFIPEYQGRGATALLRGFLTGSRWLATGAATRHRHPRRARDLRSSPARSTRASSSRCTSPARRCPSGRSA